MVDRTLLTEALRVQAFRTWTPEEWNAVVAAAQKWADLVLDFPTDAQVEAGERVLWPWIGTEKATDLTRAVLEAVGRVMIGEEE